MNKFIEENIKDYFTEDRMYVNGDVLNSKKYYVQVTYIDDNGNNITTDAVMSFTGTARNINGIDGTFVLQTSDGKIIPAIALYDPSKPVSNPLDNIKIYNTPANANGTATVEGISSLHSNKNTSTNQQTDVKEYKVSIKEIVNETYDINNPDVLYEEKIDTNNASVFSGFIESSGSSSDSIISTIKEIDGILRSTNSERFYSGTEAKNEMSKLNTLNTNTEDFKTKSSKLEYSEVLNRINDFNDKLVKIRKNTRFNLLKNKIDEINNRKKLVDEYTENVDKQGEDRTYYSDGKYLIEETYSFKITNLLVNFVRYKKLTKKYIYLQYSNEDSIEKLEGLLKSIGETLPYDKTKVIED